MLSESCYFIPINMFQKLGSQGILPFRCTKVEIYLLRMTSDLLDKIEGHQGRVNGLVLLVKEEGLWTISDDRTVRLYLKRDSGQYWLDDFLALFS